eukprot:7892299-Pyramimonas_sp.AAC.1
MSGATRRTLDLQASLCRSPIRLYCFLHAMESLSASRLRRQTATLFLIFELVRKTGERRGLRASLRTTISRGKFGSAMRKQSPKPTAPWELGRFQWELDSTNQGILHIAADQLFHRTTMADGMGLTRSFGKNPKVDGRWLWREAARSLSNVPTS